MQACYLITSCTRCFVPNTPGILSTLFKIHDAETFESLIDISYISSLESQFLFCQMGKCWWVMKKEDSKIWEVSIDGCLIYLTMEPDWWCCSHILTVCTWYTSLGHLHTSSIGNITYCWTSTFTQKVLHSRFIFCSWNNIDLDTTISFTSSRLSNFQWALPLHNCIRHITHLWNSLYGSFWFDCEKQSGYDYLYISVGAEHSHWVWQRA